MLLVFWISVGLIAYAYVGYPLLLYLIYVTLKKEKPLPEVGRLPKVSLLISAYNEEESIEKKLVNTLELSYPPGLLEIIAISDGSTDRTDRIIQSFADHNVILKRYDGRIGKTACLNRTVPLATGEILIFSDANALYHKESVKSLISHFTSPKVGFVTGHTYYMEAKGSGPTLAMGMYAWIEAWTKRLEGSIGSCICADGAIFAIRKNLYKPLKDYDINDFVIPLNVLEQGYRGLLEPSAFCQESPSRSIEKEFVRQVRIKSRTLRAIFGHITLLNPLNHPILSFQLISHKLLKFFVPLFLLLFFLSNILLAFVGPNFFYLGVFILQLVFYALAFRLIPNSIHPSLLGIREVAHTFLMVNWAIVNAWAKLFEGETFTTWDPVR